MFIITKLIHIKFGYETEVIQSLQNYYPLSSTHGFINIEFNHIQRTDYGNEYMIRILWKTQEDYHEWISHKKKTGLATWKQQFQHCILSSKSNVIHMK
ncbi:hypothetical protein ACRS6Y_12095 [Bacillus cytotoxicus]|uniref:ABM domain-containing protein n=1 Tax=Bacillus cytotoxicus (strain DSM 22905 / CIP 110041 / 391-98 / NVH 391-98) TaxID=315749 RepID=A7GLB2_BACCN|nr:MULTISPECIES: hypothetical protein [Bacillus cereus group]ABS20920.1 conserved hypothetical protein [Bacillus cytotoxicus NVH 391-98]AWC27560.1 hypothetical protein CG483_003550 [Bacillus cytotoxicus]AWC31566.1 hypothetical protein CG482_003305 [Bacillus cytotoxicus]AWC35606.1 hypothetical protein CG481_003305 [Bacillus cytotoxicus]AWC41065.1 hypothetical protein CG480_011705 [Bacillus cytotoxicus]